MGDTNATDNTGLYNVFTGGLSDYFDALTQLKLAQAYNQQLPPAGYAIGPNGQLVAQATQKPVTTSGAAAAPGGVSWVIVIGGVLVGVAVLAYVLKG